MGVRSGVRRGVAASAQTQAFKTVLTGIERAVPPRANRLAVLMYHRVGLPDERPELDPALISATPAGFREQVAFLASRRPVIALDRLLATRRGEDELPPGALMLTFDDAYADFATIAWPILREFGLPVTLFVATAYPEDGTKSFWWDRLHAALQAADRDDAERRAVRLELEALPHDHALAEVERYAAAVGGVNAGGAVLSWRELRRLADEGVTLAPHTRTHPLLDRVKPEEARAEIEASLADFEREVGAAPPVLAYPGGAHSDAVVEAAAASGIEIAFTTTRGINDLRRADWLRLRRINVGRRAGVPAIRAQLIALGGLRPRVPRGAVDTVARS